MAKKNKSKVKPASIAEEGAFQPEAPPEEDEPQAPEPTPAEPLVFTPKDGDSIIFDRPCNPVTVPPLHADMESAFRTLLIVKEIKTYLGELSGIVGPGRTTRLNNIAGEIGDIPEVKKAEGITRGWAIALEIVEANRVIHVPTDATIP